MRVRRRQHRLTWGAVSSGELESVEGARTTARAALCACAGPKGCRRGLGLRLPSESLLWLLGGVGGRCRWSMEPGGKGSRFHPSESSDAGLGEGRTTVYPTQQNWGPLDIKMRQLLELIRKNLQDALLRGWRKIEV